MTTHDDSLGRDAWAKSLMRESRDALVDAQALLDLIEEADPTRHSEADLEDLKQTAAKMRVVISEMKANVDILNGRA